MCDFEEFKAYTVQKAASPEMTEKGKEWVRNLEDKVNLERLSFQMCLCACVSVLSMET